MARRALLIDGIDTAVDCASVTAPTVIVSGEPALDFVVPSDGTIEYARMIAGARAVTLKGTGHLGSITKPREFAELVNAFLAEVDASG